jgi:formylglycine-generating enzyme required for sulfatase activity
MNNPLWLLSICPLVLLGCDGGQPSRATAPRSASPALSQETPPPNMAPHPEGMVLIPDVKYVFRNGKSKQDVQVKRFYIDKYETTWKEFQEFMTAAGYRPSALKNNEEKLFKDVNSKGASFPVGFVSWEDAKAYAHWKGKRLPSPQEWQLAALGPAGREWPWGDWDPKAANVNTGSAAEVGGFPKDCSLYGVFDMGGNMLEWTTEGTIGGSYETDWQSPTTLLNNTDDWVANTGFRCVMDGE